MRSTSDTPIALAVVLVTALCTGCASPRQESRVEATYDKQTGNLNQLKVDAKKDGKPDIFSYMDKQKFVRIEIDENEDGRIDRWEYYGDDQKVLKIGLSRANNGKPDAWAYRSSDGALARMEISTKRDGRVSRTEFYESGLLARAEEDTNGDGRVDKWETYRNGALVTAGFDADGSGKPTYTVDYSADK